jgi:hypothetical protein
VAVSGLPKPYAGFGTFHVTADKAASGQNASRGGDLKAWSDGAVAAAARSRHNSVAPTEDSTRLIR